MVPIALSWSPPYLDGWCALAVLTNKNSIGIWEPKGDPTDQASWKCSVVIQDAASGPKKSNDRIIPVAKRSKVHRMAWTSSRNGEVVYQGHSTYLTAETENPQDSRYFTIYPKDRPSMNIHEAETMRNLELSSDMDKLVLVLTSDTATDSQWSREDTLSPPLIRRMVSTANDVFEEATFGHPVRESDLHLWAEAEWKGFHVKLVSAIPTSSPHYLLPSRNKSYAFFTQDTPGQNRTVNRQPTRRSYFPWEYDMPLSKACSSSSRWCLDYTNGLPRLSVDPRVDEVGLNCAFVMANIFAGVLRIQQYSSRADEDWFQDFQRHLVESVAMYLPELQTDLFEYMSAIATTDKALPPEEKKRLLSMINTYIRGKESNNVFLQSSFLETCPLKECHRTVYWKSLTEARCASGHPLGEIYN
ncbi:MAG: hypothetical protein MMC23_004794 [Stictis urceolatum]|nr:hypothetical protein [Stictis urceolata]